MIFAEWICSQGASSPIAPKCTTISASFNNCVIAARSAKSAAGTAPTVWGKDKFYPDNEENSNYKLCVKGIEKAWTYFAPGMGACYVWIDYTCLDQDTGANPAKELKHLSKIMEISDCLFTPLCDKSLLANSEDLPATKDYLDDFPSTAWKGVDPSAYLNRAWCRLEMFYNSYIPTLDYCNSEKREEQVISDRYTKFKGRVSFQLFNGRRPHLLYTSYEEILDLPPILVPPITSVYEHKFNPCDGHYSCVEDKEVCGDYLSFCFKNILQNCCMPTTLMLLLLPLIFPTDSSSFRLLPSS